MTDGEKMVWAAIDKDMQEQRERFHREGYRVIMKACELQVLGWNKPDDVSEHDMVSIANKGPVYVNGELYDENP